MSVAQCNNMRVEDQRGSGYKRWIITKVLRSGLQSSSVLFCITLSQMANETCSESNMLLDFLPHHMFPKVRTQFSCYLTYPLPISVVRPTWLWTPFFLPNFLRIVPLFLQTSPPLFISPTFSHFFCLFCFSKRYFILLFSSLLWQ